MFSAKITIPNKTGLHARPATQLTMLCQKYEGQLSIIIGDKEFDPKSIISILSAGIGQGQEIELTVEGPDEEKTGQEIVTFIEGLTE